MKNKYSLSECIKNIYSLIYTKIFFNQARLIRRPVYIRGKKSIDGGKKLTIGRFCRFDLKGDRKTLYIGDNCQFGDNTHIVALKHVEIGNNVLIASKVFISDTSHGVYKGEKQDPPFISPEHRKLYKDNVTIGNNVWIGENVVILAGSKIGDGCIIGANSIITKNIPNYSIVIGNNYILKKYNEITNKWEKIS